MATPTGARFLWEARQVVGPPLDGATLPLMTDQSGNGNNGDPEASGNRALWVASAINGQPAADFSGTTNRYRFLPAGAPTALDTFTGKAGGTIVAVTQDQSALVGVAGDRPIAWWTRGGTGTTAVRATAVHNAATTTDPLRHRIASRRTDAETATNVTGSSVTGAAVAESHLFDWAAAELRVRLNNTPDVAGAMPTAGSTEALTSAAAYVGCNAAVSAFYAGLLAFLGVWDRLLSDTELSSLHTDLAATYALPGGGLPAPTGITYATPSPTQADLSWNAVPGASSYEVERDGVIVDANVLGTTWTDTGLTAGATYSYRIRAEQ